MAQCHFFMEGGDVSLEGKGWRKKGVGWPEKQGEYLYPETIVMTMMDVILLNMVFDHYYEIK